MSGRRIVTQPCQQAYRYDGSLAGLYCCIFEAIYLRQMPLDISAEDVAQVSLLPEKWIETQAERALRVRRGIERNISPRSLELVEMVFLSCMEHREMAILQFLLLGFEVGARVTDMLPRLEVAPLLKAEKHLAGECHLLKGFVRFSEYDGKLVAAIEPKNFVLPLMAEHFADRYSQETFMIYDRTHQVALTYVQGKSHIGYLEAFEEPEPDAREEAYRTLWKQFYRTIGIKARDNPRCRMSHMPKRYWASMTEMREYL